MAEGTENKKKVVSFNSSVQERAISARRPKEEDKGAEENETNKLPKPGCIGDKGRSPKSMYLLRSLANSLGFNDGDLYDPPEKYLDTVDVDGVVKYIKSGKCKNILFMCGAGISTSAGIPDYRSPGTGMLDILKKDVEKFGLPDAKAIYTYEYFKNNPEPYFHFASKRFPSTDCARPTASHYFIRLMGEKGLLMRNFTQNIDNLEQLAGQSKDRLVQVHGNYHNCYCQKCYHEYTWNWCLERVHIEKIPKCTEGGCCGIVRPDIVMFGETLPSPFFDKASQDCPQCDLLIILGTSLAVAPFNRLCSNVPETAPRLMINNEKVGTGDAFFALMGFGSGLQFDSKNNYRDVFVQDSCDNGCYALADALGWGDELRELIKTEHARLDALAKTQKPPSRPLAQAEKPKPKAAPQQQEKPKVVPSLQKKEVKPAVRRGSMDPAPKKVVPTSRRKSLEHSRTGGGFKPTANKPETTRNPGKKL